jgi:hypothetical protein
MIERRWIVKNRHRVAFCFFAFVCFFCLISPLICGPLEDGLAAYEKEDYESAFRLLQPFAEQGNADAQKCLGYMYDTGQGVPQDYAEAICTSPGQPRVHVFQWLWCAAKRRRGCWVVSQVGRAGLRLGSKRPWGNVKRRQRGTTKLRRGR